MRVPIYAAVNASVEIAKIQSPHHVKFINAVLRQIARDFESNEISNSRSLRETIHKLQMLPNSGQK